MKSARKKKWTMCDDCSMMIYAPVGSVGNHRCPVKVRAQRDTELDMVVDAEMSTFNNDLRNFWNSRDVQFYKWLADNKKL
jgi:hypothetical protein